MLNYQRVNPNYHRLPQKKTWWSRTGLAKSPWNSSNLINLLQATGLYPPAGSFHALEGSVPSGYWQQNDAILVDSRGKKSRCHQSMKTATAVEWLTNHCWIFPRGSNLLDTECWLVDIPRVRTSPGKVWDFDHVVPRFLNNATAQEFTEHAKTKKLISTWCQVDSWCPVYR